MDWTIIFPFAGLMLVILAEMYRTNVKLQRSEQRAQALEKSSSGRDVDKTG
ncbi:hypothetical protein [Marinococcus halophilus]|uniref:hypothetical protein n=1 Tax=Marinococcus halophilus TaxID=1371 RepID=UPI0015C4A47D|nr:hypothetical protein [Marinococcus halophilus]